MTTSHDHHRAIDGDGSSSSSSRSRRETTLKRLYNTKERTTSCRFTAHIITMRDMEPVSSLLPSDAPSGLATGAAGAAAAGSSNNSSTNPSPSISRRGSSSNSNLHLPQQQQQQHRDRPHPHEIAGGSTASLASSLRSRASSTSVRSPPSSLLSSRPQMLSHGHARPSLAESCSRCRPCPSARPRDRRRHSRHLYLRTAAAARRQA